MKHKKIYLTVILGAFGVSSSMAQIANQNDFEKCLKAAMLLLQIKI